MIKRILSVIIAFLLALFAINVCANESEEVNLLFKDIENSWAIDEITELAEKGILRGMGEGLFAPESTVSRAEFSTMIFNALKLSPISYANVYPDVSSEDWYADTVQTLYELDIIDKTVFNDSFYGGTPITREEMASLLVRGYGFFLELPEVKEAEFKDADKFSPWAQDYILMSYSLGLMNGKEDGLFCPGDAVTRAESAAVIKRLREAFRSGNLNPDAMPWKQAPVIYRTTDEIKPDEAFHVYGYGLEEAEIYAECVATAGERPSDKANKLEIMQHDKAGHFITARLSDTLPPGSYKIWAKNQYGIGDGIYLNSARPAWVDMDCAYEGLTIRLIGFNLLAERFDAESKTAVKLTRGNESYDMENVQVEPYAVKFKIPAGVPVGEYDISVTNDGIVWNTLENEQNFEIWEKGNDPFKLGVAWEKNYVYDKTYNIRDYGAKGDGVSDDTIAMQAALDDAEKQGGGIVYLPIGRYRVSHMELPARTIIAGESKTESVIIVTIDDATATYINTRESALDIGYQGMTNLSMVMDEVLNPDQDYPSVFLWAGNLWDYIDAREARNYEGFFLKNINVNFPLLHRGGESSSYVIAEKYLLVSDCNFTAYRAFPHACNVHYQRQENNNYNTVTTSTSGNGAFFVFENNTVQLNSDYVDSDGKTYYAQGTTFRSDAYIAHNKYYDTGSPGDTNDGEVVMNEHFNGGVVSMLGKVIGATENSVTLEPELNSDGTLLSRANDKGWEIFTPRWGRLVILITHGKGLGQYRRIVQHENKTYTIDRAWDIVPDETSSFVIGNFFTNNVMYANEAVSCEKGFWFYGGSVDSVIADCVGIHMDSVYATSFYSKDGQGIRFSPNYFISFKGNIIDGPADGRQVCSITSRSVFNMPSAKIDHYADFGTSIKDNSIKGGLYDWNAEAVHEESPRLSYLGATAGYNGKIVPDSPLRKAVIIEGNKMTNMKNGIVVGDPGGSKNDTPLISGVVVKDNIMKNVKTRYIQNRSENVVIVND